MVAKKGDYFAQYKTGSIYASKGNTVIDELLSFLWFKMAALNGHVLAQYELGNCYLYGKGIKANKETAFVWYDKAVKNGDPWIQYEVGQTYEFIGEEKKAFECFKKSAESGYDLALQKMGECYEYGIGVEINKDEAQKWYDKFPEKENELAEEKNNQ